jgi:hypothetical protein
MTHPTLILINKSNVMHMMSNMTNKKKIAAVTGIVAVVVIAILAPTLSKGTVFEMDTSANQTGYYQIGFRNPDLISDGFIDIEIHIVNSSGTIRTFSVTNGKFADSTSNKSLVYYSYSQSYAVVLGEDFKADCTPIECVEIKKGNLNILTVRFRGTLGHMEGLIGIGEITESDPVDYDVFDGTYEIQSGHNYSIYLYYRNNAVSPFVVGSMTILPPTIIEEFYPITYALNVTNYEVMSFTINSTMINFRSQTQVFDVTQFDYLSGSYTTVAIMPASCGAFMENIFTFTASETVNISCSLLDGALDQIFASNYLKFKIGGGFN